MPPAIAHVVPAMRCAPFQIQCACVCMVAFTRVLTFTPAIGYDSRCGASPEPSQRTHRCARSINSNESVDGTPFNVSDSAPYGSLHVFQVAPGELTSTITARVFTKGLFQTSARIKLSFGTVKNN